MTDDPPMETERLTLTPRELRIGDIVHAHGMICRVVHAPILSRVHPGANTYWTKCVVENRADVSSDSVPYAYTREADGSHAWTIQGNDLAMIAVERMI